MKVDVIRNYSVQNFGAKLVMPKNEEVCKLANEACAEHLEIARPTLERIANVTKDLELIKVTPSLKKDTKYSQIQLDVLTKKGTSLTKIVDELQISKETQFKRPLHKYIIDTLIDTIGFARMGDVIFKKFKK